MDKRRLAKALFGAAAMMLAVSCGDEVDITPLPSGRGSVNGAALGTSFAYSPQRLVATFAPVEEGNVALSIRLCQLECDPLGLVISQSSRAVMLFFSALETEIQPGRVFEIGLMKNEGLALFRDETDRLTENQTTTQIAPALSGTVTLTEVDLRRGGTLTGSFNLQLKGGGSVTGEFLAPLLDSAGP